MLRFTTGWYLSVCVWGGGWGNLKKMNPQPMESDLSLDRQCQIWAKLSDCPQSLFPHTHWNLVQEYKKSTSSISTATNLVVVGYKSGHNFLQIYPLTSEVQFAAAVLVAKLSSTLLNPMDCSLPGSFLHGIARQEYWSGLQFPCPGDPPKPGTKRTAPALAGRFFTHWDTREAGVQLSTPWIWAGMWFTEDHRMVQKWGCMSPESKFQETSQALLSIFKPLPLLATEHTCPI